MSPIFRYISLVVLLSGCTLVLVDEPCDPVSDDTGDAPVDHFVAVGTGAVHSCGIRDEGDILCWGEGEDGQRDAPAGSFAQLAVGHAHSCALDTEGTAQCWGRNDEGQTELEGVFIAISTGGAHSCGLDENGLVDCVGRNDQGQIDVPEGKFLSIAAGASHTCGIVEDESEGPHSVCWGGVEKEAEKDENHRSLISGMGWACATAELSDPDVPVICIGDNSDGQHLVPGTTGLSVWTAGARHGCGLDTAGAIVCWGANDAGQQEAPSGSFSQISSGPTALHTCAIATVDGSDAGPVECWGLNAENQLAP
jgi:hypothetical protein